MLILLSNIAYGHSNTLAPNAYVKIFVGLLFLPCDNLSLLI